MIGMGSVVDKDMPSGVIAYGTPCKVVRENKWRPKSDSTIDDLIEQAKD